MDDIKLLDAVERYIRGEMTPDERLHFEQLRKANAEVDQLVVEHTLFLQQMNRFSEWKKFKQSLQEVHINLAEQGEINSDKPRGRIVYLWRKYKKVTAIAASIAGITTIVLSALVWSVAPKTPTSELETLKRKLNAQENKTNQLQTDLNHVKDKVNSPVNNPASSPIEFKSGGTGFLIDAKGLMITNAHIVKNSRNIRVVNAKGQQFNAFVVRLDITRDVAVIKIDDDQFKPAISLPYSIRKSTSDIAEPVFTLGYPRDEIVYGEGYLSARTGFNGDTLSCQISIAANPGNSGGPIFDHNGEVIGILTSKETETEGVVFAVQSKYIYRVLDDLKKSPLYKNMKLPTKSTLSGLEKTQQVKKIQDFVFIVKGD
ncbi:MAG: trypsin-like peptidase domain-containing protein [Bacteroidetes bacterium]|nr:MAG: trypsin-like peptidase domain-containing protein [Bacteroidota bacterium]